MTDREGEPRVILSQELGGTSVESNGSSGETETTTGGFDGGVTRKLSDHEEEESQIKKEEEADQSDIDPQGRQTRWVD